MAVFVKAVDTGSFAAAADALGMSAQMVGKHVRMLEEHLGMRLIERTTRRQSVTGFGKSFYERSRTILAEMEAAEELAQESTAAPRGLIRITAPIVIGAHRLAPALPAFLARFPEISVELTLLDRITDLIDEGFDFAFRVGHLPDSALIARPLQHFALVVCASPSYLASHGAPRVPQDLEHHECLCFAHGGIGDRWPFAGPDGPVSVEVSSRFSANNGEALLSAAAAGLGIILQPEILVSDAINSGNLVPLLTEFLSPPRPMHLLYASDRRMTPKKRAFIDFALKLLPAER
jgi:DNA-binding transcriptional LysR family regulator